MSENGEPTSIVGDDFRTYVEYQAVVNLCLQFFLCGGLIAALTVIWWPLVVLGWAAMAYPSWRLWVLMDPPEADRTPE